MSERIKVATIEELTPGKAVMVEIDGKEIAVFNVDGNFYALDGICPHRDGPIHEGHLEDATVICPWHFARFDLRSGDVLEHPSSEAIEVGLRTYCVQTAGDHVVIVFDEGNEDR